MDPFNSESPPARTTILSSLLRGRPRNSSTSQAHPTLHVSTTPAINDNGYLHLPNHRELSPVPTSPNRGSGNNRRSVALVGANATAAQPAVNPPYSTTTTPSHPTSTNPFTAPSSVPTNTPTTTQGLNFAGMLRRRRSAGTVPPTVGPGDVNLAAALGTVLPSASIPGQGPTHRIRIVPQIDSHRSLRFDPITRDLSPSGHSLRIGRFTDRSGLALNTALLSSNKIAFRSKVVSRNHAEVFVDGQGKFWIRDTKSSSGTFLNHVRLSPANQESKATELRDGDVVQFGVDYQGGAEEIYKSVKVRIEIGREWQAGVNAFNSNAIKQLRAIAALPSTDPTLGGAQLEKKKKKSTKTSIPDCCICLFGVRIQQALFVAPCSHAFHFKCIRPLIEQHHPAFNCPLCRTYADLNADVEVDPLEEDEEDEEECEDVKAGAETEVEDGVSRTRVAALGAARASPSVEEVEEVLSEGFDDLVHVEHGMEDGEEGDVVMLDDTRLPHASLGVAGVSEMGEGVLVDADATVGEKRKR